MVSGLMMDFGATVCSAKAPKCDDCPVRVICQAQRSALSKGFSTYKEYLASQVLPKKSRNTSVRFEDSDRYFRGRIIDLLRERQMSRGELWGALSEDHGLADQARFSAIVQGLLKDQMIRSDGDIFQLG
jgi:A/G-specific adenine glycosylase